VPPRSLPLDQGPPDTRSTAPVVKEAASEGSQRRASVTSSGSLRRAIGMRETIQAGRVGLPAVAWMSGWTARGATVLTQLLRDQFTCEVHRERVGGLALRPSTGSG